MYFIKLVLRQVLFILLGIYLYNEYSYNLTEIIVTNHYNKFLCTILLVVFVTMLFIIHMKLSGIIINRLIYLLNKRKGK